MIIKSRKALGQQVNTRGLTDGEEVPTIVRLVQYPQKWLLFLLIKKKPKVVIRLGFECRKLHV